MFLCHKISLDLVLCKGDYGHAINSLATALHLTKQGNYHLLYRWRKQRHTKMKVFAQDHPANQELKHLQHANHTSPNPMWLL